MPSGDSLSQSLVATIGSHNPMSPVNWGSMAATKSKKRSPHAGVVLLKPSGRRVSWRARFEDPDSGKLVFESLDPLALRTAEARRDWGIRKAKALAKRRLELSDGAARKTGVPLADGLTLFFAAKRGLGKSTLAGYTRASEQFQSWCAEVGVSTLDQVTKPRLLEFRDTVTNATRQTKEGGQRSGFTINRELREVSVLLHWLHERGKLPSCSSDDLRNGLKRIRASVDRIQFLGRGEPARLLQVCLNHDRIVYSETRAEHRGDGTPGSTPRYDLVAPFALTVLLSGMRFSEALSLEWSQVDLGAIGHEGKPVGELYLRAANVKTKRGREVSFDISPSLLDLFTIMKKSASSARVFDWLTEDTLNAARKRLKAAGAPATFSWQALRRTCGTYLTNSPSIHGSASAFHSAKRLGHGVAVAEKHYLGTVKGIPHTAKTIEQAMSIEQEAREVVELVRRRLGGQHAS
jgi:integrase